MVQHHRIEESKDVSITVTAQDDSHLIKQQPSKNQSSSMFPPIANDRSATVATPDIENSRGRTGN